MILIGIDGGGTHTRLAASDETGRVISYLDSDGTNAADLGINECAARLTARLKKLLGDTSLPIESVYAGIAGTANETASEGVKQALIKCLPGAKHIANGTDALNPLFSESDEGIVLIAGTGSSSFAVTKEAVTQVGGWGYLIDDAGSGFRIGADTLKCAFRDLDGRGEHSLLTAMCENKLGMSLKSAIPTIYSGGKSYIASFAPLAFEAMIKGDASAVGIVTAAAAELAKHLIRCLDYIPIRPAVTVINGGLTDNNRYLSLITEALGDKTAYFRIIKPDVPPVYGALVKAARNAGLKPGAEFKANFLKGVRL